MKRLALLFLSLFLGLLISGVQVVVSLLFHMVDTTSGDTWILWGIFIFLWLDKEISK